MIKRYLRLYGYFLQFSFSRALEFRVDFTFRIFMDSIFYLVQISFFHLLYLHTPQIGGLTNDQGMIFAASVILADSIEMTFLANNMWFLPIFIRRGDLDYYLTRPISARFFLSLRDIAANSFINFLMAIGIVLWAFARYPYPLATINIIVYLILLLLGVYLIYLLRLMFLLPIFLMQSSRGLEEIFFDLSKIQSRPHAIYQGRIRYLVLFILPFAITISFPVQILFFGMNWRLLLHFGLILLFFSALLQWLWNKALQSYSSASS